MSLATLLLTAALDEALAGDDASLDSWLRAALLQLHNQCPEAAPAVVLLDAARGLGAEARLAERTAVLVADLDRCPGYPGWADLALADAVFDLAGRLDWVPDSDDRAQAIASLDRVWAHHRGWRRAVGDLAGPEPPNGWVDPATSAEESLLALDPARKKAPELSRQLDQVRELGDGYPDAMRDYCLYTHLVHAADQARKAQIGAGPWLNLIARHLVQTAGDWQPRQPALLTYTWSALRPRLGPRSDDIEPDLIAQAAIAPAAVREALAALPGWPPLPQPPDLETLAAADYPIPWAPLRGGWS